MRLAMPVAARPLVARPRPGEETDSTSFWWWDREIPRATLGSSTSGWSEPEEAALSLGAIEVWWDCPSIKPGVKAAAGAGFYDQLNTRYTRILNQLRTHGVHLHPRPQSAFTQKANEMKPPLGSEIVKAFISNLKHYTRTHFTATDGHSRVRALTALGGWRWWKASTQKLAQFASHTTQIPPELADSLTAAPSTEATGAFVTPTAEDAQEIEELRRGQALLRTTVANAIAANEASIRAANEAKAANEAMAAALATTAPNKKRKTSEE